MEDNVDNILLTYLHKNTFSGCAAAFCSLGKNGFKRKNYFQGRTDKSAHSMVVNEKTFFDLASLTKPLVTVLSLLVLKKEEKIYFDEALSTYLPLVLPEDKKEIKIIDLIRHTSGLPAHRPYYLKCSGDSDELGIDDVIEMILQEELVDKPGEKYIYSDLDYILLGHLIEQISGECLGKFWQRKITYPLGISEEFYREGSEHKPDNTISFAVTGRCGWSGEQLCGKVHDDNCRAMGRICGHAGLFGTLYGVTALCEELVLTYFGKKENPAYARDDLLYLLQKRDTLHWAYGFDIPTGEKPSCGRFFSDKTIGHLGFTGTSFWIDLSEPRIAVFLTNRTLYGEDNTLIKEMRPVLHDALLRDGS